MLIDGEKWACEACVRGHRVSNCQHFERPLQHINKKGRPVTQCHHCRSQRKNRSAHIKCDCGEKTNKCVHLGAVEGHRESCCCNHGGRCSCAFKNDLDTVPETSGQESEVESDDVLSTSASATMLGTASAASAASRAVSTNDSGSKSPPRRRRANTTRSEGTLTFDEHGRHKPLSQKHAKAVSQKTCPYPVNRMNSSRSTSALSGYLKKTANDDEDLDDIYSNGNAGSDSGAEDAMPSTLTATTAATAATSCASFLPAQTAQQRRSRSETASPLLFANSFPQAHQLSGNSQLTPLNMGMVGGFNSYTNYNAFSPKAVETPLFSAGLSAPSVDWSQFGLDFDRGFSTGNDGLGDAFDFPQSIGYDYNGSEQAPTMTTGTSGEVSEAEDTMVPGLDDYDYDYDYDGTTDTASSSIAFSRASSAYHLPAAAVVLARNNGSSDNSELCLSKAGNKFLPTPLTGAAGNLTGLSTIHDEEPTLWMTDFHGESDCHGLPTMTESPESDVLSFWATT